MRFGAVAVVMGLAAALAWYGIRVMQRERSARDSVACQSHVLALARAIRMYADEEGAFPVAERWCDEILPYVKDRSAFTSPRSRNHACSYAFNAALGERRLADIRDPGALVAIFESDIGWNATGGRELLPEVPRHQGGDHLGFADGSSAYQKRKYTAADRDGPAKRLYTDVRPNEWLQDYLSTTGPIQWVPRPPGGTSRPAERVGGQPQQRQARPSAHGERAAQRRGAR